jgi:hypothetical protein
MPLPHPLDHQANVAQTLPSRECWGAQWVTSLSLEGLGVLVAPSLQRWQVKPVLRKDRPVVKSQFYLLLDLTIVGLSVLTYKVGMTSTQKTL